MCTENQLKAILDRVAATARTALGDRLHSAYLYGSYARGEATAQSDLDFRADVPADFGMFRLSTLQGDLEDAFHKKVDLITEGMLSDPLSGKLARNIEEDEVVLYGVGK